MNQKKDRKPLFSVTAADCRKDTFASGGPGGQYQNKTQSGVRFTHPPSGAVGESREHRSQEMNKRAAWKRMCETKKFQTWCRMEAARRMGKKTVDQQVEEAMADSNIKTETLNEKTQWVETKVADLKAETD